jgi:hypothetical protein
MGVQDTCRDIATSGQRMAHCQLRGGAVMGGITMEVGTLLLIILASVLFGAIGTMVLIISAFNR